MTGITVQRSNFRKFIIFLILVEQFPWDGARSQGKFFPGGWRAEGGGRRAELDEKGKFLLPFRNAQEQEVGRSDGRTADSRRTEVFTLL